MKASIWFRMFNVFFAREMEELHKRSMMEGIINEKEAREAARHEETDYALKQLVGKPVIGVSNEWENPVVGFCVRVDYITQSNSPVPVVKNYLTGEEVIVMGKLYAYSTQRLSAILGMTPWAFYSLYYARPEDGTIVENQRFGKREKHAAIAAKLIDSGFYDAVEKLEEKFPEEMLRAA